MNIKNIKRVRDHIAGLPPARFDMRALFLNADGSVNYDDVRPIAAVKECGTAACIAGWAAVVLRPRTLGVDAATIGGLFGLEAEQRSELFCPMGYYEPGRYTLSQAVRVLDHLVETGEVRWDLPPAIGQ